MVPASPLNSIAFTAAEASEAPKLGVTVQAPPRDIEGDVKSNRSCLGLVDGSD